MWLFISLAIGTFNVYIIATDPSAMVWNWIAAAVMFGMAARELSRR